MRKPLGWDVYSGGEYKGFVPRSRFPVRAWRTLRYKYPNTCIGALYVAASVAALFWGPSRRWGILALALLGIAFVSVALEKYRARSRR